MPIHFNDALDDPLLYDAIESFGGGIDAFTRPTLLGPDVSQYGENIIVQDNLRARTRPGVTRLGGAALAATPIQGLFYFDKPTTTEQLLTAVGGNMKMWNGSEWASKTGYTIGVSGFFEARQGLETALFTDGANALALWDGTAFTTCATGVNDPPAGASILCWHVGRMFASGFPGSGGSGKEDDAVCVSGPLAIGNGNWDHSTWSFRVGNGSGDPVKAIASLQGNYLAVLKENSVWLVYTNPTETSSAAGYTIEPLAFGNGCVGRKAWVSYGNDVIFMSQDGVRSVRRMQAAAGQWELSPPMSIPIQPYIDRINWTYASTIKAVKYNEFALFAVPLDSATTPNTVLVWNGRLQRWLGIWTGWTPTEFEVTRFGGVRRLVFGDSVGAINQWLDYTARDLDTTYLDNDNAIASKLWTRSTVFGEPINDKSLYHGEARFVDGTGVVTIKVVTDYDEVLDWNIDLTTETVKLPQILPFFLPDPRPWVTRKGLRGIREFGEVFLKVESTAGWWDLRNITLSAFLNRLKNQ